MGAGTAGPDQPVVLGRIAGVFGVRGWVRVFSFADPREEIFRFSPWWLCRDGECRPWEMVEGRSHGKGLIARLETCDDRDRARELVGCDILVPRAALPPVEAGRYYWVDLIGLRVETLAGQLLGRVDHLLETGANDVLVIKGDREHLIPYVSGRVVREVDLENGVMQVDWDPEF
ncbi:MAG TPA: ribosome maturation factor RimM [Gammaproteobacteria bacterium]|nr:ribosome maturation factor RimM [Gammaproteobacteria bacterium]